MIGISSGETRHQSHRLGTLILAGVITLLTNTTALLADQKPASGAPAPAAKLNLLDYLPPDVQAAVLIRVPLLIRSELLNDIVPPDKQPALFKKLMDDAPFDVITMEQVALCWSAPLAGVPNQPSEELPSHNLTLLILFKEGASAKQQAQRDPFFVKDVEPLSIPSGEAWRTRDLPHVKGKLPVEAEPVIYLPNKRLLIVGCRGRVLSLGSVKHEPPLIKKLLAGAKPESVWVAAATPPERFELPKWLKQELRRDAEPVAAALSLLTQCRQLLLQGNFSAKSDLIKLELEARNEETAKAFEQQLQQLQKQLAEFVKSTPESQRSAPGPTMLTELLAGWTQSREGTELKVSAPATDKLLKQAATTLRQLRSGADEAPKLATRAAIGGLEAGLKLYAIDHKGEYPSTNQGLEALLMKPGNDPDWHGPYLEKLPKDSWGNPLQYRYPGKQNAEKPDIFSFGPDKIPNTDDDITNWSKP